MALSHLCPMDLSSTWILLEKSRQAQEDPLMGPERNRPWNGKDTAHCLQPPLCWEAPAARLGHQEGPGQGHPRGHGAHSPAPLRDSLWAARLRHPRELRWGSSPAGLGATLAYGTSMNHLETLWKKVLHSSYQQSAKVPGTLYSPTGMGSNLLFEASASLIAKYGFDFLNIFFCELAVLTLYSFSYWVTDFISVYSTFCTLRKLAFSPTPCLQSSGSTLVCFCLKKYLFLNDWNEIIFLYVFLGT